ncbi:MAG: hypothetical protein H7641_15050, partial [Candidatus Heimdallarchaeota archaeon]|nr:hypothetical protein [Candidatus Heimdallarchaeota archaeon]MCK4878881.1 hypothetical protein [Candidatus Heimdallarchaeota archaeon]
MTIEKTQAIKDLEKTITQGEFDIAFDQIDEFLKSNETTTIEKIQAKIWNCMLLFWVGRAESNREKLSEASRIISDVLSECEELGETELIFDALVWYNWYLWVFSKTREFVEGVNRQ